MTAQRSGIILENVNELMVKLFRDSITGHISRHGHDLVASFKLGDEGEAMRLCRCADPLKGASIEIHRDKASAKSEGTKGRGHHSPNALLVLTSTFKETEDEVWDVKKGTLYCQTLFIETPEDLITLTAWSYAGFLREALELIGALPSNHVWQDEIREWKEVDKSVIGEKPVVLPAASSGSAVA